MTTTGSGWLGSADSDRWAGGTSHQAYEWFGGHLADAGAWFAVWAPHAESVSVIGDFNDWTDGAHPMRRVHHGCWEVFVAGAEAGDRYKYRVRRGGYQAEKTDPFAVRMEPPAFGGSAIHGLSAILDPLDYEWGDRDWMARRAGPDGLTRPMSIYEVHLGSWRHRQPGESYSYRDLAAPLAEYVTEMGFTHVEFMPVAEHGFYGSWGYQVVGYFAPTYRYGSPDDFMYLVDTLHQNGIGVILDWVPAHFATDPQGLVFFDGSTLYEYDDPLMRNHPDWGTCIFDYTKPAVRSFLISNALFWLDRYHIDGLRVDAVASMLYRDYSRSQWTPNRYGGRENLEAIDLVKQVNEATYVHFPTAMTIAEESTAFPRVSAPTYDLGLGFLYKWNMGWMHDVLAYFQEDPVHRKYHHNKLTFSFVYAFSEHYVLPFSHDEVVHGKGSLWSRMPGDPWQKAANMRLMLGHMFAHPGKKMLFMGSEFAQPEEWDHDAELNWEVGGTPLHAGIRNWVQELNVLYRRCPALWNDGSEGWSWIGDHAEDGVLAYLRTGGGQTLVVVLNLTPVPRPDYHIGVPQEGLWLEQLNSDHAVYGGSGVCNVEPLDGVAPGVHGQPAGVVVSLPPLAALFLTPANSTQKT